MDWYDNNTIGVIPTNKPKKITGTRFASILGLNAWNTPFKTWCEITKTYEEPFTDSIYTIAGKTIEPKQAEFMQKTYFMTGLKTPTDIYGKDYFKKTFGDFFPENKIFGGMWDYLEFDKGKPVSVLEMKTTKRAEDWVDDIPEYYSLQASLYAYLLGVDQVHMVCSFLESADYEHPEDFEPNTSNTVVKSFKVSERYPDFELYIAKATEFWEEHVKTGISPEFTDKDKDIIKILKTNNVNPDTDLDKLIVDAEHLKKKIDANKKSIAEYEKNYKKITEMIKQVMLTKFDDNTDNVTVNGNSYIFNYSRKVKMQVDSDKLANDGLIEKYSTPVETYTLTIKEKK